MKIWQRSTVIWLWIASWAHQAASDFVYPGSLYPSSASACPFPNPARSPDCPYPYVNSSISLAQFSGIDQEEFTFTASLEITISWLDDGRILNSTAVTGSSSCNLPCSKAISGALSCCDAVWLPTLHFANAQAKDAEADDYEFGIQVVQGLPSAPRTTLLNLEYVVRFTATFDQPFTFDAFPFDRHALAIKFTCPDCRMISPLLGRDDPDSADFSLSKDRSYLLGKGDPRDAAYFDTSSSNFTQGQQVPASINVTASAQAFPESSGWRLDSVDMFTAATNKESSRSLGGGAGGNASRESGLENTNAGIVFIVRVTRVTRVFYTLRVIIPPIILVLIGFGTFITPKEKFSDRLKTLVALMFPLYIFQFNLSSVLPDTFTLLAPNYLVFVSIVIILLLVGVAALSFVLVNRQRHVEWKRSMRHGRAVWKERRASMRGNRSAPAQEDPNDTASDPKLFNSSPHTNGAAASHTGSAQTNGRRTWKHRASMTGAGGADFAQDDLDNPVLEPDEDPERGMMSEKEKEEHDKEIAVQVANCQAKSWPGIRAMRIWWKQIALTDIDGYRQHVALYFEICALSLVMLLYIASVLAIFIHSVEVGNNANVP